jgi:hypothetical protein
MKNLTAHADAAADAGVDAVAPAPALRRRPARLWMTGSLAVVMMALMPGRFAASEERPRSSKVARPSPYSVDETVQRIEAAARGDGLSVLVRLDGARPVIVLASSVGGTPVVLDENGARPDMPLALQVRAGAGGGSEVLIAASAEASDSDWTELPAGVAEDLARLPGMLDRALS